MAILGPYPHTVPQIQYVSMRDCRCGSYYKLSLTFEPETRTLNSVVSKTHVSFLLLQGLLRSIVARIISRIASANVAWSGRNNLPREGGGHTEIVG